MIAKVQTIYELCSLFVSSRRWWLVPMFALLAIVGVLLVVLQAAEYVAPFVYTVF